jgi:hypothetical protein
MNKTIHIGTPVVAMEILTIYIELELCPEYFMPEFLLF